MDSGVMFGEVKIYEGCKVMIFVKSKKMIHVGVWQGYIYLWPY